MMKINKSVVAFGLAVAVLYSTPVAVASAEVVGRQALLASSVSATSDAVRITQLAPGSFNGKLQWSAIPKATEYRIYKTGSIRPSWRLFAVSSGRATSRTVVDQPGAIAIYRVMAVVNTREVLVGSVTYTPKR